MRIASSNIYVPYLTSSNKCMLYILTIQYLDNTSTKTIRLQLQEKLDCDLTDRKKKVDLLVIEIIDEQSQDDDEEGEEEKETESEEENPPKKNKLAKLIVLPSALICTDKH